MKAKQNKSVVNYIALHLSKIQFKPSELYALSRLIHKLDDPEIHLAFQQCIYITPDKTGKALADLYLPQFSIIVEVDEPHHLNQKEADEKREQGIREVFNPNIKIERIPFAIKNGKTRIDLDDEAINNRIDKIVMRIKHMKEQQLNSSTFIPWSCGEDKMADYYIKKGFMSVDDGDAVKNVNEVLHLDKNYEGHMEHWSGFKPVTSAEDSYFWCPGLSNNDWKNILTPDGEYLSEERLTDLFDKEKNEVKMTAAERNAFEVQKDLSTPLRKRVTFVRERTPLGEIQLRFAGIFVIDEERSKEENHPIWRRVATKLLINEQNDFSYLNN